MAGGEVFVPKIPSTTILDIATAVAPECRQDVIGIRPGEKLHECMIPLDEARQTLEFEDFFVIQPTLRSWTRQLPEYARQGVPCEPSFIYSSDNNDHWLSPEALRQLIAKHCPAEDLVGSRRVAA